MRVEYTTPGVYLKKTFPIQAAKELITGVPVFLGVTDDQEFLENIPKLLTLPTQIQFNQSDKTYLAHAVRGFFENGGRFCYVVKLRDLSRTALNEGLDALELLDEIDLVCAPDIMQIRDSGEIIAMQQAILEHCERSESRFAILDSFLTGEHPELKSANGAIYTPWIKIENHLNPIPPCGHIAGVYARSDKEKGVYQAPANYVLEGVVDLSSDYLPTTLTSTNYLRALPGRGIRVWGCRTLSDDQNWQYINVRRLFLTVNRWLELNFEDIAFEPNDFRLWVRIERQLTAYLESLRQQGALQGNTSAEAFFVKCDAQTNPASLVDNGQIVAEIGFAPIIPKEFIVMRLIHDKS